MKHNKMMFGMLLVFVFLLSVGLTYAYFNIVVSGNNDATSINTSTGTLNITYNGGAQVVANNIYPGWTTTKTFTVENTGTLTAYYQISFIDLTNTILNDELKMSGTTFSSVSAGYQYTLAIDSYGDLFSWGYNLYGQLGNSIPLTHYIPSITNVY